MPKQIVRIYRMEDEAMEVRAQSFHNHVASDLAAFTAKFPWLDAPYLLAFQADITAATNFPRDGESLGDQKVLTGHVNDAVAIGQTALKHLRVYAELAYEGTPEVNVFGQADWKKAYSDQEKMRFALKRAHDRANVAPYKAALLAKGMKQVDIDLLSSTADDVEAKNQLQEDAMSDRPATTFNRISTHNIVWNKMRIISLCSQLVYEGNTAKLNQFLLYPQGSDINTEVIVHVHRLGAPDPRVGADVVLTNTALAHGLTDAGGNFPFNSVNMPDFVDVSVTFGGITVTKLHQPVLIGDTVTIDVEV